MDRKPQKIILNNGEEIIIRAAIKSDLNELYTFFSNLPVGLKHLLRVNLELKENVEKRLSEIDNSFHWRIIAEHKGKIIGDTTLDRALYGWKNHVGDFRIIINPEFQHKGIGTCMILELLDICQARGIEILDGELIAHQEKEINTLLKMGFRKEFVRKNYIRDIDGKLQDMVIMSNRISEIWQKLESHIHELDYNYSTTESGLN